MSLNVETCPPLIIICPRTLDWVEWQPHDLRWPEAGDCPHGECDCVPAIYGRLDLTSLTERWRVMARHEEGKKVKFTKAEMGTVGVYKPTWEQEQNVLSFRKVLLRRHLLRWLRGRPGAAYVPFMGDGDIADALYRGRDIYGADLDAERVGLARGRFPGHDIRIADCDNWPFPDIEVPMAIADFDAFTEPYTSFRAFWNGATKADRLVVAFTDGHRQGLIRTGWFDKPDGTKVKLGEGLRGEAKLKAPYYWKYLSQHIWPYFDGLVASEWRMLDRWRYQRDMMIYWGMALERKR